MAKNRVKAIKCPNCENIIMASKTINHKQNFKCCVCEKEFFYKAISTRRYEISFPRFSPFRMVGIFNYVRIA